MIYIIYFSAVSSFVVVVIETFVTGLHRLKMQPKDKSTNEYLFNPLAIIVW